MNSADESTLPVSVLSAFFGLLPVGVVLGLLYGIGVLAGRALTWMVLTGVTAFVAWAVVQLDTRSLKAARDKSAEM